MTWLDQMISATRERVARSEQRADLRALERMAAAHVPRGLRRRFAVVAQSSIAIIAELKKASHCKSLIRADFQVMHLTGQVATNGHLRFLSSLRNNFGC